MERETGQSSPGVSALSGHSTANWQQRSKLVVQRSDQVPGHVLYGLYRVVFKKKKCWLLKMSTFHI